MAGNRIITALGSIKWDDGQIRILLSGEAGETAADIQRRARAVQRRAQSAAPMRTGELRGSISVNTTYPSDGAAADITADAPHALAVEFGRKKIDLKGSKHYLNWTGDQGEVFTQTAGPVAATHFMRDALDEAAD